MEGKRLLVVTTVRLEGGGLREYISQEIGEPAELRIVAPAAKVSPLQWLASDEDDARAEAESVAESAAGAVEGDTPVEAEVGDPDPIQAIEDALRTFPADEVVVVTPAGERANWLEQDAGAEANERFGVPVRQLEYRGG